MGMPGAGSGCLAWVTASSQARGTAGKGQAELPGGAVQAWGRGCWRAALPAPGEPSANAAPGSCFITENAACCNSFSHCSVPV